MCARRRAYLAGTRDEMQIMERFLFQLFTGTVMTSFTGLPICMYIVNVYRTTLAYRRPDVRTIQRVQTDGCEDYTARTENWITENTMKDQQHLI
jgi:hypothetical protein